MLLTLAMSYAVSLEAVDSSKTEDLPDGDAKLAWKTSTNIYQPNIQSELQALRQQFNHCTLTDASYLPDKWFEKLETLKIEMKNMDHTIDDETISVQILLQQLKFSQENKVLEQQFQLYYKLKNEFCQVSSKYILTDGKKTIKTAF
jgi:hypothetical protein